MKKLILILIPLLLLAGAGGLMGRRAKETQQAAERAAKAKSAPVPVLMARAATLSMPVEIRTFGSVEPMTTVAVKSQISGVLSNVLFSEGQEVHEGDLLFLIDPRPAEAALRQAEAARVRDRVQCANAVKEAERQDILLAKGISAQDLRDTAVTAAETFKAAVQADEAALELARLQLDYCSIRSPVSGRTGTLLIHRGNLVKADEATLVEINQIRPIRVRFTCPQQDLARIQEAIGRGAVTVLATPAGVGLATATGTLTFVDNAVNENTGTIQLKARFGNEAQSLWPGQFVTVSLLLARQEQALTVPETAVLFGQQGAYVYVVEQEQVASRPVTVDRTQAGVAVISRGLAAGEVVVTDGQLRLKSGTLVTARPAASPGARTEARQ